MKKPAESTLTPQELAIMKIVWRRGTATVREVYEDLRETRRIAYTTVMTMMTILASKGHLKKTKEERAYRYRPARSQHTVVTSMVREFVNRVFDGASKSLLLHLVTDKKLTSKEREELLRLIDEAEQEEK